MKTRILLIAALAVLLTGCFGRCNFLDVSISQIHSSLSMVKHQEVALTLTTKGLAS